MSDSKAIAAKISGSRNGLHPWGLFAAGLASWVVMWGMEALYKWGTLESRQLVNVVVYTVLPIGFLCCVVAPFLGGRSLKKKCLFLVSALMAFFIFGYACAVVFWIYVGLTKD